MQKHCFYVTQTKREYIVLLLIPHHGCWGCMHWLTFAYELPSIQVRVVISHKYTDFSISHRNLIVTPSATSSQETYQLQM